MKNKLKPGDLVQSAYNANWYGRVTEVQTRGEYSPLVSVTTICTADGRPHRKPYKKRFSQFWLNKVDKLPKWYKGADNEHQDERP